MNNAPCGASHRPAPCAIACKAVKPLLLSVSAPRGPQRKSPCRKCGSDAAIYGGLDTIRSKPPLPDRASYQRSEECSAGKEWVSTCRTRGRRGHKKKKNKET